MSAQAAPIASEDLEMLRQRLTEIARRERENAAWADDQDTRSRTLHALEALGKIPVSLVVAELIQREFPARENFFGEWLTRQSLVMTHAWRGIGKTFFALEIAYATASGGEFLKWGAPQPRRVLYLDGEMPGSVLQERLARIAASAQAEPPADFLRLVTPDAQDGPLPDLATPEGQEAFAPLVECADLVIVDNLSCLARRGGKENEGESWIPVADWALRQRAAGRSVLFVHHSGKGGLQRGTSRREDLLDVVIGLRRPAEYKADEGARFIVSFEKARGLTGDAVAEFEAALGTDGEGKREWTTTACEEAELHRIADLVKAGATQKDAADELGLSRFQAKRRMERAVERGLIEPDEIKSGRGGRRHRTGDDE